MKLPLSRNWPSLSQETREKQMDSLPPSAPSRSVPPQAVGDAQRQEESPQQQMDSLPPSAPPRSLPPQAVGDALQHQNQSAATYKTRAVHFSGRTTPIVLRNADGPCPLVAICNVLLLRNHISLSPDVVEVSQEKLLTLVRERLIGFNNIYVKDANDVDSQQKIADVEGLLRGLATGIGASDVFDMLNIPFYKVSDRSDAVTSEYYISTRGNFVSLETRKIQNHESEDNLRGGDNKMGKGDREEEAELQRALRLSETVHLSVAGVYNDSPGVGVCLQEGLKDREFCVFFRENHFSTMFKFNGELYLLVDQDNQREQVWEKLNKELTDRLSTAVYIHNLDANVTEKELKDLFSRCGDVISAVITTDGGGKREGSGMVFFSHPAMAKYAVNTFNGCECGGKTMRVAIGEKNDNIQGSDVYVKNIDNDVTNEEQRDYFGQSGTVTSSEVMREDKGISKGFGFVRSSVPSRKRKRPPKKTKKSGLPTDHVASDQLTACESTMRLFGYMKKSKDQYIKMTDARAATKVSEAAASRIKGVLEAVGLIKETERGTVELVHPKEYHDLVDEAKNLKLDIEKVKSEELLLDKKIREMQRRIDALVLDKEKKKFLFLAEADVRQPPLFPWHTISYAQYPQEVMVTHDEASMTTTVGPIPVMGSCGSPKADVVVDDSTQIPPVDGLDDVEDVIDMEGWGWLDPDH